MKVFLETVIVVLCAKRVLRLKRIRENVGSLADEALVFAVTRDKKI